MNKISFNSWLQPCGFYFDKKSEQLMTFNFNNILIQGYNAIIYSYYNTIRSNAKDGWEKMAAIHNQWLFNDDIINQNVENVNTSGVISKKL